MIFKRFFLTISAVCLSAGAFYLSLNAADRDNLIKNGGFESGATGWSISGAEIQKADKFGKSMLVFDHKVKTLKTAYQIIDLNPGSSIVTIKAYIKLAEAIREADRDSKVGVYIEFQDANGTSKQTKETIGELTGNNDWLEYSKSISVPTWAKKIKIFASSNFVTGISSFDEFYFTDDIQITAKKLKVAFKEQVDDINIVYTESEVAVELSNGNFEDGVNGWNVWNANNVNTSAKSHSGYGALRVENWERKWMGCEQIIPISSKMKKITLCGWMKAQNVRPGKDGWEKQTLQLKFYDAGGQETGSGATADISGTKDWKFYYKSFLVPEKTVKVGVLCALGNALGVGYFDDIYVGANPPPAPPVVTELLNGSFEGGSDDWKFWGGELGKVAKEGNTGALITNKEPKWSGIEQIVGIEKGLKYLKLSGWMKTENVVPGKEAWEKATFRCEFQDENGKQIGDPVSLGDKIGTTDWDFREALLKIPTGAAQLRVMAALGNSTGTIYLDDVKLDKTVTEADYVAAKAFINNPGFENGIDGWPIWYGDVTTETFHSGKASLKVSFPDMGKWQMRRQRLSLPKGVRNFTMKGWVKLENAATSASSWEGPRVYVEFVDKDGVIIPGLQPNLFRAGEEKGQKILNKDWMEVSAEFLVPGKAVEMEINAGLANTSGTIYIDDLSVQWEKPEDMFKSIKKGWYAIDVRPDIETGHYVDWSSLLDAPAGKHGFVKVVNGHHVFEDGTPAKFWGTNFMAEMCFSNKDVVDSLTDRLAKMGNNVIRVHHMDAPWNQRNIFGNKDNTRTLSEQRLEMLDYLMATCKKKGIYIYLDLLVQRDFMKSDGVPYPAKEYGGKQVGIWDPKIIELQKEYYDQIFSHVNQYTGLAYKDDPVIIGSVMINETWAGGQWSGDYLTPEFTKQFDEMFAKSEFSNNGQKKRSVLTYKDGPGYYKRILSAANRDSDSSATMRFLHDLEKKYVEEMYAHLKKIGVKYPVAYTNLPMAFTSLLKSKARADMILNNMYWSHPWVYEDGKYSMTTNTSMSDRYMNNLVQENATYVVEGKPFMVSEWNDCYPNETRIEGPVMAAAYGALQGWDGFMAFTFPDNNVGGQDLFAFHWGADPAHVASWVVAAPMFLRGDIKMAPNVIRHKIEEKQIYNFPNQDNYVQDNYQIPYVTRFENTFDGENKGSLQDISKYIDQKNLVFKSETGELQMDGKNKNFQMFATKIQGVVGNMEGRTFDFNSFSVKMNNEYGSAILVSKDNKPLSESKHFYLVVETKVEMNGQKFRDEPDQKKQGNGRLELLGKYPIIAESAVGTLTLKKDISVDNIEIIPLSPYGKKGQKLEVSKVGNGISIDLAKSTSFVYEVKIK